MVQCIFSYILLISGINFTANFNLAGWNCLLRKAAERTEYWQVNLELKVTEDVSRVVSFIVDCMIFFFLCGMHHADISLQSGRFSATVIASSSERLFDLGSCWIVFIHVVRGRPGGFLQSSEGEAVMILLHDGYSQIL